LLYVEPIYTRQRNTDATFPILRFVVVRFGTQVGVATTLQGALDMVFSGDAGAATGETEQGALSSMPDDVTMTAEEIIQSALAEAAQQFQAGDEALRNGDLAGYQRANEAARAALERAAQAMGQ
jgi:uncharacterized membrane protein (UPF0182 family)